MAEQPADVRRSGLSLVALLLGPALAAPLWFSPPLEAGHSELNAMAGVAVWMAVWWLTECVPPAATGLLPLVLLPLLSLTPARGSGAMASVAASYGDSMIFLFLGGFLIALAIARSGLERRIALAIVTTVGDSPRRLVLGFMLATAALSMWMSNTATAMMMLPIAISITGRAAQGGGDPQQTRRFSTAVMIGIAYGANIGGFATLIGTPPNVAFKQLYTNQFPAGPDISFAGWMVMAVPLAVVMLLCAWLLLTRVLFRLGDEALLGGSAVLAEERKRLGRLRPAEWRAGLIFLTTAVLWVAREPVAGFGWAPWLGLGRQADGSRLVDDSTVAMTMAVLCFVVPSEGLRGKPLMDWQAAARVPWGVLLMFGGGLALAQGMQNSALDMYLGRQFGAQLQGAPPILMAGATAVAMTFLTELTSNLACTTMSMPILGSVAQAVGCDPRLLMIPAAIAASCAFMLPVATPPNAIVYGSGHVKLSEMIRCGILMNLLGAVLIVAAIFTLGVSVLGITTGGLPDWADAAAGAQ